MPVREYLSIHGARLGIGNTGELVVDGHVLDAQKAAEQTALGYSATIELAASSTTDGMDITITVVDQDDAIVAAVHALEFWMSEDDAGIGLTADAYSGDLTATTGSILSALTAKKHWTVVTAATGIFEATLVDSANPTDQYVAVKNPLGAGIVVSEASGTNWEGAA